MIFFDVTKSAGATHRSGLTRVSARLGHELGPAAKLVTWPDWPREAAREDWLLTSELFSGRERPGLTRYLEQRPCRLAAIFHDAIPLKHPHITWPQSVARHPEYLKLLARFDRVWAVSKASKEELEGFWRWQGVHRTPPVDVLPLGADFNAAPRVAAREPSTEPLLLCLGIVEPRKNQAFLVEVCESLWREGLTFQLHVVGRVNPHFGKPIVAQFKKAARSSAGALIFHEGADDATMTSLYARARATVFPTIAEGCGLPLLESLWMGVPCVCSDLPVLRENADAGGCLPVALNDLEAWTQALREVLTNDQKVATLTKHALTRPLPTWAEAAKVVQRGLR